MCGRRPTRCAWTLLVMLAVGTVFAVVGHVLQNSSTPTGELPIWYTLETCRRFANSQLDSAAWDIYQVVDGTGTPGDCQTTYTPAAKQRIEISEDDGVRMGALYYPTFLLQSDTYATISFSVEDKDGHVLMPTANVELGPPPSRARPPPRSRARPPRPATPTPPRAAAP